MLAASRPPQNQSIARKLLQHGLVMSLAAPRAPNVRRTEAPSRAPALSGRGVSAIQTPCPLCVRARTEGADPAGMCRLIDEQTDISGCGHALFQIRGRS